jgi:hypothetical protein
MTEHLYDSAGNFIAFRRSDTDKYVFDADGNWIGWLPYGGPDVRDTHGAYLGMLTGNRLRHMSNRPFRGLPGLPARRASVTLPPGVTDLGGAA